MIMRIKLILFSLIFLVYNFSFAQTTVSERVSYMKDYVSNMKSSLIEIRALLDSSQKLNRLDTLDYLLLNLESDINNIPIPASEIIPPQVVESQEIVIDDKSMNESDNEMPPPPPPLEGDFDQFGNKGKKGGLDYLSFFKTKLYLNFGLNGLIAIDKNSISSLNPEVNTTKSWYWTLGFKRPIRLSNNDKIRLFYGLDYNENSFSIENNLRLYNDINNVPTFIPVDSLSNNNKLKIGYIRLPLELNYSFSRKFSLSVGAFLGYRVYSLQKFNYRKNGENIEESRYGKFGLNDWCYGSTASIGYGFFKIVGSYNFSNILKKNDTYTLNPYSIGFSLVF